jgi:hypothetical protein
VLHFDIEPRAGYLYATVSGEFDLSGAQSGFRAMLQAAARHRQPRMLLDCTRVTGEMTIADRLAFGSFIADEQQRMLPQLPAAPQVAILAVPPIMDPGRFTQAVANNRGARLRASDSLQELLSWLGV